MSLPGSSNTSTDDRAPLKSTSTLSAGSNTDPYMIKTITNQTNKLADGLSRLSKRSPNLNRFFLHQQLKIYGRKLNGNLAYARALLGCDRTSSAEEIPDDSCHHPKNASCSNSSKEVKDDDPSLTTEANLRSIISHCDSCLAECDRLSNEYPAPVGMSLVEELRQLGLLPSQSERPKVATRMTWPIADKSTPTTHLSRHDSSYTLPDCTQVERPALRQPFSQDSHASQTSTCRA